MGQPHDSSNIDLAHLFCPVTHKPLSMPRSMQLCIEYLINCRVHRILSGYERSYKYLLAYMSIRLPNKGVVQFEMRELKP
jgi:hypothetical protein